MPNLIAIVGRPNVGKSAVFNRIAGKRIAIVHDEPGVTRDRVSATVDWHGESFELVDTGGIGLLKGEKTDDPITKAALVQVQVAVESAQVIILVVDAKEGLMPLDREVADQLREAGKPVVIAVNKVDNRSNEPAAGEFDALGFESVCHLSAMHDTGIKPLVKTALRYLPEAEQASVPESGEGEPPMSTPEPLKLAIVGRPNVGKSSIINSLIRSDRVIVNDMPGTTRDAVDVPFTVETEGRHQDFLLIDTAGLRKRARIGDSLEFYSAKRAETSIGRADLALLVLDAEMGITEQDKKIGDLITKRKKACIVLVNKWDLVEPHLSEARKEERKRRKKRTGQSTEADKPMLTLAEFGEWVQEQLFFLSYAPVIFSSAKSGFNLDRLLEVIRYVQDQWQQTVPTALLNRVLHEAIEQQQPVSVTGERLKFYYATQKQTAPPTFLLFVNRDELLSEAYTKYLAREIRNAFGFEGCPITLIAKPRPRAVDPIREDEAGKVSKGSKPTAKAGISKRSGRQRKR